MPTLSGYNLALNWGAMALVLRRAIPEDSKNTRRGFWVRVAQSLAAQGRHLTAADVCRRLLALPCGIGKNPRATVAYRTASGEAAQRVRSSVSTGAVTRPETGDSDLHRKSRDAQDSGGYIGAAKARRKRREGGQR